MVEKAEPSRAGHLTYPEFVQMMCNKPGTSALQGLELRLQTFRDWFQLFDVDGDKILPLAEFSQFMSSTGFEVDEADLSEIDADGNGYIEFYEFINVMTCVAGSVVQDQIRLRIADLQGLFKLFDYNLDAAVEVRYKDGM